MRVPEPTNPWHISRAYGVPRAAPSAPVSPARETAPTQAVRPALSPPSSAGVRLSRLVAAAVPGRVDFAESGEARVGGAAIALYSHPADRNSAATGVEVGRRLDATA